MKRTISLKLCLSQENCEALSETQKAFNLACNMVVSFAVENRCWNRVDLHHLCYYSVRKSFPSLKSQMVCNAIRKVCSSYKVLKIKKSQIDVPTIEFNKKSSIHYDKRTYTLKRDIFSLSTLRGRVRCSFKLGSYQKKYLSSQGTPKEAELVRIGKQWFFNLVLDIPDVDRVKEGCTLAVDVGENNLAVTSTKKIHGGKKLRHKRDKFLNRRKKASIQRFSLC